MLFRVEDGWYDSRYAGMEDQKDTVECKAPSVFLAAKTPFCMFACLVLYNIALAGNLPWPIFVFVML